jgi:hypothetical protein
MVLTRDESSSPVAVPSCRRRMRCGALYFSLAIERLQLAPAASVFSALLGDERKALDKLLEGHKLIVPPLALLLCRFTFIFVSSKALAARKTFGQLYRQ